jgi:hypothetical protein
VKDPPVDVWIDADGLVPRQETVINCGERLNRRPS